MDRSNPAQESEKRPEATRPASKRRFRLEKLEERIAPAGHYNKQSKWVGGSSPSTSLGDSESTGTSGY